jgi:hypothetical protein
MFCPKCGKEQVDNPAFCRNCGERLRLPEPPKESGAVAHAGHPDNDALTQKEPKERQMSEQKQRHGCLTALLVLMIVANSAIALVYLIGGSATKEFLPGMPLWVLVVLGMGCIFNLVCAIALLQWKKWGFWGFVASSIVALCLYLSLGLGPLSLLGLLGLAVLYGVLHIGKENKGWPQLD